MSSNQLYDARLMNMTIRGVIEQESRCFAEQSGTPINEAMMIVAYMAMGPSLGTMAAAMGKQSPDGCQAGLLRAKLMEAISELPDAGDK